ncbi:hypothetical protein N7540_006106 [Penicillium herquei]|nr:hypothetical protein N7540_006106 [Penicillium herquei]
MCWFGQSSSAEGSPPPPPSPPPRESPPAPPAPPWPREEGIELTNLAKPNPEPKPEAPERDLSILFPPREIGPSRDPYYPLEWFENRGRQSHEWMRNPLADGCPIRQSRLTWDQILAHEDVAARTERQLSLKTTSQNLEFANSYEESYPGRSEDFVTIVTVAFSGASHMIGNFTPRVVELISLRHETEPYRNRETINHPHISEMVVAAFNAQYGDRSLMGLRDISVIAVHNPQTIRTLTLLYAERYPRLYEDPRTPDYPRAQVFDEGTPEYFRLLGTRIGRTVSSIILAGFPRGTRSITRIWTEFDVFFGFAEIRFQLRDNTAGGAWALRD